MSHVKKLFDAIRHYWPALLIALGTMILAYGLLFRSLGTLPGGYSDHEVASQTQAHSLHTILQSPVNAPYKLMEWATLKLGYHALLSTRIIAAIFAIGSAVLFYWIVLHWYSRRIAILATALFIGSSGYLHIARYGTALVLQMATLSLMGCVWLYQRAKREYAVTYTIAGLLAIFAYIPGMLWFQLVGLLVLRKGIAHLFQRLGKKHAIAIITLYAVLISPIVWAALQDVQSLLPILGLPSHIPTVATLTDNALDLVKAIFYRGYYTPAYWLYGAPLLNIAEVIFFLTGLFVLGKQPFAATNAWLIAALIISTVLIVIGGSVAIAVLIPLVYLVIAGGIYYLLDQWLSVFPRNPIARNAGVTLLSVVVAFSVYYHFRAYYIAWPRAPETKHVYIIKQS